MRMLRMLFRQAKRNRLMMAVNLFGLTLSTTVLILLALLVLHEVNYDRPIPNSERLVLIGSHGERANGQGFRWPIVSAGVPIDLSQQVAGIENFVRLNGNWEREVAITRPEKQIIIKGAFRADSSFFDVTGVKLTQGDPNEALVTPGSAVITRNVAQQLFGDKDPMGETFNYTGNQICTVTGVIDKMPAPSMLAGINMLLAWSTFPGNDDRNWNNRINHFCLLELEPGVTAESLQPAIDEATVRYFSGERAREGYTFRFTLTP